MFMLTVGLLCGAMIGAGGVFLYGAKNASAGPDIMNSVPDVRQSVDYSCGAACTQAVFNYWGIDLREDQLMAELNTTEANGTSPGSILRVAAAHGLAADIRMNLTLTDIQEALGQHIAVIIVAQAWTDNHSTSFSWASDWADGHYMVVIGMDARNVYLEDPAILGSRGSVPRQEFLDRWHDDGDGDIGAGGMQYIHMGIYITGAAQSDPPAFVPVL